MEETKIEITKETLETIKEVATQLFDLIGLKTEIGVSEDKDNEAVMVELSTDDATGLIIGRRGETISAIQYVLGIIVRQKLGGWVRIIVNIGDWREKQEQQLKDLALQAAERARETGETQSLYNLNSSQRRIVHMILSEESDITTESDGEGRDRRLTVTVKK